MVLQFQPPPYRDTNKEIGELWGNAISSLGQNVNQMSQQAREQRRQEMLMEYMKKEEARKQQEQAWKGQQQAVEYGVRAPSSESFPISGPMTFDQSLRSTLDPSSPASPAPASSQGGMVEKFRQWQEQRRSGAANPKAPTGMPRSEVGYKEVLPQVPGFTPDQIRSVGGSGYSTLGTKRTDELKKLFGSDRTLDQTLADKVNSGKITLEQAYKMKSPMGGQNAGKVTWKQNAFTGEWEAYPVALPSGSGNAPRQDTSGGGNAPRIPFREAAKLQSQVAENDVLVNSVIGEIERVQALNKNSRGGWAGAASQKLQSGLNIGTDSPEFRNTADVVNTMQSQVARVLKSTFGGQLSDDERRYLNNVYGALPTLSPSERDIAMTNVKNMMKSRGEAMRSKVGGGFNPNSGGEMMQGGGVKPMTAVNPKTGQRIQSTDGGQTWSAMQ